MVKEKRNELIQIRVSPTEKKIITQNAVNSNTTFSDYMRSVSLAGYRVKHGTEVSREVNVSETRVEVVEEDAPPQKQRRQSTG